MVRATRFAARQRAILSRSRLLTGLQPEHGLGDDVALHLV